MLDRIALVPASIRAYAMWEITKDGFSRSLLLLIVSRIVQLFLLLKSQRIDITNGCCSNSVQQAEKER